MNLAFAIIIYGEFSLIYMKTSVNDIPKTLLKCIVGAWYIHGIHILK